MTSDDAIASPPTRSACFTIGPWRIDGDLLRFSYECDRFGAFGESAAFGAEPEALKTFARAHPTLIDLLAVALGVSYYKLGAAETITLPPLPQSARAMAAALYGPGLAEFAVRAGFGGPLSPRLEGPLVGEPVAAAISEPSGPALVAFGGGKDSYVADAILRRAGVPVTLCSVVLSDAVATVLTQTAPAPIRFLTRRLDPRLRTATPQGFNGHVPITAINILMLTISAALSEETQVVFANERSADEPTLTLPNGEVANHQYSKSSAFEEIVRRAVRSAMPDGPVPWSILRPYSELWIGTAFAGLKTPFSRFTSCNRNFQIAGHDGRRWCGACAKCAFTSLILAPVLSDAETVEIFGEPFLDREELMPFYTDLLGLGAHKPWDCVGTIDECRAALFLAHQNPASRDTRLVREHLPRLLDDPGTEALERAVTTGLTPDDAAYSSAVARAAAEGLIP